MYHHLIAKSKEGLFLPKILESEFLRLRSDTGHFHNSVRILTQLLSLVKEIGRLSGTNDAVLSHYLRQLTNEDGLLSLFDILLTVKESSPLFSVLGVVAYSQKLKNLKIGSISWRSTQKCRSMVLAKGNVISQLAYYFCRMSSEACGSACYFGGLGANAGLFRWHIVTRALSLVISLALRYVSVVTLGAADKSLKAHARKSTAVHDEGNAASSSAAVVCHPFYRKLPSLTAVVRDLIGLVECVAELSPRIQSIAVCRAMLSILRLLGIVMGMYFSGAEVK